MHTRKLQSFKLLHDNELIKMAVESKYLGFASKPRAFVVNQVRHAKGIAPIAHMRPIRSHLSAANESEESETMKLDDSISNETFVVSSLDADWKWHQKLTQIVRFALPVAAIPLADPLLGLIDVVSLGHLAGALYVASLAPSLLLFNFISLAFNGFAVATLALVSTHLQSTSISTTQQDSPSPSTSASGIFSAALVSAVTIGVVAAGALLLAGPALLSLTGCHPELLPSALSYLYTRAGSLPIALSVQVAQATLLAQRNTTAPVVTVVAAGVTNLVCNLVFIGWWGWGTAGAGAATGLTQCLALWLLFTAVTSTTTTTSDSSVSSQSIMFRFPKQADFEALQSNAGALSAAYVLKHVVYFSIQRLATGLPGTQLAAHQSMWSLWNCAAFLNAPLERSAMAFLPEAAVQGGKAVKQTSALLLGLAGGVGVLGALTVVIAAVLVPGMLSPDVATWSFMRNICALAAGSLILCALDSCSNGVLVGIGHGAFLGRSMAVSAAVMVPALYAVAVAGRAELRLQAVWWAMAGFFVLRAVQNVPKALKELKL